MDYGKEISYGAFDSELMHQEIFIPEGFEATIDGNKIILKKTESENEQIRKELKHYLEERRCQTQSDEEYINCNKFLNWLEKQRTSYTKKYVDNAYVEGMAFAKNELEKQGEKNSSDKVLKIRQELYQSGYNDGYKHGCEDTKKQGEQKSTDEDMKEALRTEYEKGRADAFTQMQELTWKPSDEQMEALNDVISSRDIKYDVLSELWKDLKKLKEE